MWVLLITKLVGGCGLDLDIANHILNLDPDWVHDTDYQVECRVNRLGQTKRTFVLRFMVEGTLDAFVMRQQDAALIEQMSFYRTVFTDKFDKKCEDEKVTKRPVFEELHDPDPYDHSPFDHLASAQELEVEFPVLHALQASLGSQASQSINYIHRNVICAIQLSG